MKKPDPKKTMKQSMRLIQKLIKDPKFTQQLASTGHYIDYEAVLNMWKEAARLR